MQSMNLYAKLAADFEKAGPPAESDLLTPNEYIHPGFREFGLGLMLDNAAEISRVYTAVFPDREIVETVLRSGRLDALLFTLHPLGYNGLSDGSPFYDLPIEYYQALRDRRISLYVLQPPLDLAGKHSPTMAFARLLGLRVTGEFRGSGGTGAGIICHAAKQSAAGFADYVRLVVGHEVQLYLYGEDRILDGLVAVAAGAGNDPFIVEELARMGLNLYLTGFTRTLPAFPPSVEFHRQARRMKLNVIGATRYSTEKYACIAMRDYFKGLGLEAEFIEGRPYIKDL